MKLYKNIILTLSAVILLVTSACEDSADQFGGNNPKSGYVAFQLEKQLTITDDLTNLSLPVELNTSTNPNGVKVSYTLEEVNGTLPNGFVDNSNGSLIIKAGEVTSEIELTIPQNGTEYSFRVTLTGTDDADFTVGLVDNSKVVSTDIFVLSNEPLLLTIDENPIQDQLLATIESVFGAGATFSLAEESIIGSLSVNEQTGALTVLDPTVFDWEINPVLTAKVESVSGTLSTTKDVQINLNDITIFWNGPVTTFVYEGDGDISLPENQDRMTDNVWITRDVRWPIYNAAAETQFVFGDPYPTSLSPVGTQWAVGKISDGIENLAFNVFATTIGNAFNYINNNGNQPLVVHLVKDDVYLELTWIDWHRGNGNDGGLGGFSYQRSTP